MPSLLYTCLSVWIRRTSIYARHLPVIKSSPINSKCTISIPAWLSGIKEKPSSESKNTGNVNFYDQIRRPDGSKSFVDAGDNYRHALHNLEKEGDELDETAKKLERETKSFKMPKSLPMELIDRVFPKEDREKVTEVLATMDTDLGLFLHRIKSPTPLPRSQNIILARLNDMMDRASIDVQSSRIRKDLWRFYQRGKIHIPDMVKMLPDTAWEILWQSQAEEVDTNPDRSAHLRVLVDDMAKAGKILTQGQRNARIEGLFLTGHRDKALDEWEKALKVGNASNSDFLELGIRMYAYSGNLARAEDLLDVLLKLFPSWDPAIAFPVISSFLNLDNEEASRRAYALYLRLQHRLGSSMTPEHYDAISLDFLRVGRKDLALAVFKDMMLREDSTLEESKSMQKILYERFDQFLSLSHDVKQVNAIGLEALTVVPRHLQNSFFYAKWLKRLIETGEIDAASDVVDLMYERGLRPNARHIHGIIISWLSQPDRPLQKKGEELAWNMIQGRLDFVRRRSMVASPGKEIEKSSVYKSAEKGVSVPIYESRPVPAGNIDTFCILVRYYLRREMFDNVRHLRNLLVDAELRMNASFMNILLASETKFRSHREVWTRFEIMSRSISPDMSTFALLWESMKHHVDRNNTEDPFGFPTPRQLFAVMMSWLNNIHGQRLKEALTSLEVPLYENILRSFLLSADVEGCFVALHALRQKFEIFPEPSTFQMLMVQATKLELAQGFSNFTDLSKFKEDAMAKYAQMLELITTQRHDALRKEGAPFDTLEVNLQAEENHRTLLQLLSVILQHRLQDKTLTSERLISSAAEDMNIEAFDVEQSFLLAV